MRCFIFLFVLLELSPVYAQELVPCMVRKGNRWVQDKKKTCVQHDKATQALYNKALIQRKHYKGLYEGTKQNEKKLTDKVTSLEKSNANLDAQRKLERQRAEAQKKLATMFHKKWEEALNAPVEEKKWNYSPVFWYCMGGLTVAGLVGTGVGLYMFGTGSSYAPYVTVGAGVAALTGIGFGLYAVMSRNPGKKR